MVTDLKKVCKQVVGIRNVTINIDPFFDGRNTMLTVQDADQRYDEVYFGFEPRLLMVITDTDLKNYLVEQIDRVASGKPIQNIRVKR